MRKTSISRFRKSALVVLWGAGSALLAGAAHSHSLSQAQLDNLSVRFQDFSKESQNNALEMQKLNEILEKCNKEIKCAQNAKLVAEQGRRLEDALAMGRKLEEWNAKKDDAELKLEVQRKIRRDIDRKNGMMNVESRKKGEANAIQRRADNPSLSGNGQKKASGASSMPSADSNEQISSPETKKFSRNFVPTNSQNTGAVKSDPVVTSPVGALDKTRFEGVNKALQKPAPNAPKHKPPETGGPRAASALAQRAASFGDIFAQRKPPPAVDVPSGKPVMSEKEVGSKSAAPGWAGAAPRPPVNQHVVLSEHDSLVIAPGQALDPQASLVVTNHLGNTHGVLVGQDELVLSGGLHSTNLRLDDDGARFVDAQTGTAVVVGGVAAGVAATDAVNVEQVQSVVDAAVTPLGVRFDGVESRVQQLDQKINAVEKKLSGGVAMAMALSQAVSFAPLAKNAVTGGVATYNGQTAMGFSFNRLVANTETRRTVVSLGLAATMSGRSSACARVGACFSW